MHVLKLSAVCQLWRYAALRTPVLWSTLELGHHTDPLNTIQHIKLWIERAQSYPLSLIIKKWDSEEYFFHPIDFVHITDYQWKSIKVNLDNDNWQRAVCFLQRLRITNLEMLESLSLKLRFSEHGFSISDMMRLGHMPKLATLCLSMDCQATFDALLFPWSQLTSLTISFWDSAGIDLDILRACVNLEELTVNSTDNLDGIGPIRSVALNYLRKLHTDSASNALMFSIKTPSIQEVAIKGSGFKYFLDTDPFYDHCQKNGSTPLKLSIAPFSSRLVEYIPYFQSLEELKLYDNNYYDDGSIKTYEVLNSIIVKPQMNPSTIPLPRLKTLELICHATEQNQKTFMEVVESRWWSDEEENMRQGEGQRSLSRIGYECAQGTEHVL